jgi:hypothetical protein
MGNFLVVPSFYRKPKRSKIDVDQTSEDAQSTAQESKDYRVYYNPSSDIESSLLIAIKNRRKHPPQTNRIRTTRYNILTFIPKNLFEQFHRIANIYFAILIGLNWVPVINAISKTVNKILSSVDLYLRYFGDFFRLLSYH